MAANIKPLKMCINVTIPSVEDTDLSLYEAMCTLAGKLQDTIKEINEILADAIVTVNGKQGPEVLLTGDDISVSTDDGQSISGVLSQKYSADNPPPYPVTSVNDKTGAVTLTASNISTTSGTIQQDLNTKYSSSNPPPYPVTSVNTKRGNVEIKGDEISVSATDDQSIAGALSQKLAYTGKKFTSWDSVRNQPCGVYRTSGFLPWSTTMQDNGLLFIIGDNSSGAAYVFFRDSVPHSLYFTVGQGTSADDWYIAAGTPISG